jgi:hypothetical protein
VIRVHNQMDVETSIHWHGILLPNAMDGVPFVTQPPIAPQDPGEIDRLRDHVVVLSDWTYEDPSYILKRQLRCPAWGRQRSTATIEKRRRI